MPNLDHFKEIVDNNLNHMDLSEENKDKVRQAAAESPEPEPAKKKPWLFTLIPIAAAAAICAVLVPTLLLTQNPFSESAITATAQEGNLMNSILPHGLTSQPQAPASSLSEKAKDAASPQMFAETELASDADNSSYVAGESAISSDFVSATANFSIGLFQKAFDGTENTLLSPLSVSLALGMASNGAENETKNQILYALGGDALSQSALNEQYAALRDRLQTEEAGGTVCLANSIWYHNQNLAVKQDFLQTNADYFQADAFQLNFQAPETLTRMNDWVKEKTGGHIEQIMDKIDDNARMYLVNAVYFDMNWQSPFSSYKTTSGTFYAQNGKTATASFMKSSELYLENETAQAIKKPYADDRYSFVAILPKNGVSLSEYIQNLTGKEWLDLVRQPSQSYIGVQLPKFQTDFSLSLKTALQQMGLTDCFDGLKANFTSMATTSDGNLYFEDVVHKTHMQVDELGTKAAAATNAEVALSSAEAPEQLVFDRPFLYAILDNETGLPLFLGTVTNPAV